MAIPPHIARRLRVPLIAAPMLRVSGPRLVAQACRHGAIGAFPTANAGGLSNLDAWLSEIRETCSQTDTGAQSAPWCPNLIMRRPATVIQEEVRLLIEHGVEMVITSVGSPSAVVGRLHAAGCLVFADVATLAHAHKALEAGADGLILLSAGAGGQTGWLNGLAYARAVREFFSGPLVLAGGVADGHALFAARSLGCDLAYMGTRFIATQESLAAQAYKAMLIESDADDVILTKAFTGLPTSMLRQSIEAAGHDSDRLDEAITPERAREIYSASKGLFSAPAGSDQPRRWLDIWSAGHTVGAVHEVLTVGELIGQIRAEYVRARSDCLDAESQPPRPNSTRHS